MHFAAAALQNAAGQRLGLARITWARTLRPLSHELPWSQSLDAPAGGSYLRFVQYEQNRPGELRIRGAGPTLAYEIVEPTTGSQPASALTCLCLHGNSSHRGIWRLVARELQSAAACFSTSVGMARASMSRRRHTIPSTTQKT
jgi:hypothetical protein